MAAAKAVEIKRTIHSLVELAPLAGELAMLLKKLALEYGVAVGLEGELGAGKTTLTSELVKALGSNDWVSSPTYVLEQRYQAADGLTVEHWDLFRVKGTPPGEIMTAPSKGTLRLIEWASLCPEVQCDYVLRLEIKGEHARSVRFCNVR